MKNILKKVTLQLVALTILALAGIGPDISAAPEPFPVYTSMEPNVAFWLKIYSQYSSKQGVLHDKRKMDIIYGVIDLVDPYRGAGRKINRKRTQKAKKKYKLILAKLARGQLPSSLAERRVADLFGPDAKKADFRKAIRNLRSQVGQKDFFRQGVIRSGAYLEEIKEVFRNYELPEDLIYLPHVESSFNPKAYSKFGAAGIWQFTRSTGKRYMTIGYAVDERRDPIRSSRAAAKLLKRNYKKFESWPMAITAYNHGTAGMLRARRIKGDYETIFKEYRSRIFRFASRNFYSEFLAACVVAKNYRQYFGELELNTPLASQEVVLAGYASLPVLARRLKVDLALLRRLNPALRKPVLRGHKYVPKGYRLRLPLEKDQDWQRLIAELDPKLFKNYPKQSRIHTVRRGDTAGEIAKRYNVTLRDLIAANNLDIRATIYVNHNLRIPLPGENRSLLAEAKSRRTPKTKAGSSRRLKPPPESSGSNPTPMRAGLDQRRRTENTQASGSSPHGDPLINSRLVPAPGLNPEAVQRNLAVDRIWIKHGKVYGRIRVEVEETLGHYAEWLKVSAKEIRKLNGRRSVKIIRLNQSIKIPLRRVTKEQFEEKRFEYHKELVENFFAAYRVEKVRTYTIKRGDSIWTLLREEFGAPLWLVKKYNAEVDFNALHPAQEIIIPVVGRKRV